MDHIAASDLPAVEHATRTVVRDAKVAGIWIFGAGVHRQRSSVVTIDGRVSDGPVPESKPVVGGFSIIECESREVAIRWAARLARACRCTQEVRELMFDPES